MSLPAQRLAADPRAPETIEDLLRRGLVRRALTPEARSGQRLSIGTAGLDAALGGGLVRGQVHEIVAAQSAGGTALLWAALAAALGGGELCALIDPADAFDPRGARAAGLELRRLLWVRPTTLSQALRATEIALEARFALVALDLADARTTTQPWARLARRAEKQGSALLVLSRSAQAGAFASATVALSRAQPRWEGSPGTPGRLLRAGATLGAVARSRRGPPSGPLLLQLPVPEESALREPGLEGAE